MTIETLDKAIKHYRTWEMEPETARLLEVLEDARDMLLRQVVTVRQAPPMETLKAGVSVDRQLMRLRGVGPGGVDAYVRENLARKIAEDLAPVLKLAAREQISTGHTMFETEIGVRL